MQPETSGAPGQYGHIRFISRLINCWFHAGELIVGFTLKKQNLGNVLQYGQSGEQEKELRAERVFKTLVATK